MRAFGKFRYLHELAVLPVSREHEPCFLQLPNILWVYLITVPMAFRGLFFFVRLMCNRSLFENARICPQAHRAAIILARKLLALIRKDVYDRMRCFCINFRGIRAL